MRTKPKSEKVWAAAVRRAVNRRLENEEGKPKKLERLADKVVELAMNGDMAAVKEIGERLDGKAAQSVEHTGEGGGPVETVTRIILEDGGSAH